MRIIFLSLAAIGTAALGGAALAQATSRTIVQGGGVNAPAPGGFFRGHPGFGRGKARHPRRHHRRFDRGPQPFAFFGVGGYGQPVEPYGEGFFADGGEVRMDGHRPVYDYDRSYPYEWDSAAAPFRAGDGAYIADRPRCTMEHGVRVCRGGR